MVVVVVSGMQSFNGMVPLEDFGIRVGIHVELPLCTRQIQPALAVQVPHYWPADVCCSSEHGRLTTVLVDVIAKAFGFGQLLCTAKCGGKRGEEAGPRKFLRAECGLSTFPVFAHVGVDKMMENTDGAETVSRL